METVLKNSFVSIQDVQLDDILPIPQHGPIREKKINSLQRSFQSMGVIPCSLILLYEFSPVEQSVNNCKYGVIDGAHRVVALKDLRVRNPTSPLPNFLTARIYRNLSQVEIRGISSFMNGVIKSLATRAERRK